MSNAARDSYNARAEEYAAFAVGGFDRTAAVKDWLTAFAALASGSGGTVADLGCGPGHVTNHLSELGLTAVGYDISSDLIAEARRRFPRSTFHVGDLTALDIADSSLGAIVSRHSLIHIPSAQLGSVFCEWARVLTPEAPVLVSFFASATAERHGSPFDHAITTAYELFPATIVEELEAAGFDCLEVVTSPPKEGQRPLDHGSVMARSAKV